MLYYITKRNQKSNQILLEARLKGVDLVILDCLDCLLDWLTTVDVVYYDKEFTDLYILNAIPILTAIGNEEDQFVVDDLSFPSLSYLEPFKNKIFIGHNIKIDISLSRLQGVDIRNIEDTMIAEQRLGLDSKRANNLEATYNRRCGKELPQDKSISLEFTKMNSNSLVDFKHIYYSSLDIKILPEIRQVQKKYIKKFNYDLLLYGIEFPLVPILADMELEGFTINSKGWSKVVNDNKSELFRIEKLLDKELTDIGFNNKSFRQERKKAVFIQKSLFGDDREYENTNANKINYNSSLQLINLFKQLELDIPNLIKKEVDKLTRVKTSTEKDSFQIEALQAYNLNKPDNIFFNFLNNLIEYKEIQKEITSFGERFCNSKIYKKNVKKPIIGYLNQKTNKIHTIYRQCMTTTGRLASGDAKIGYYNSQQIPGLKKYRNLFTLTQQELDNDWWIVTSDLTGAEVVIMCAFAKDKDLYKWAIEEDDLHSPMATKCWRAVYDYRKTKQERAWITNGRTDNGVFKVKSTSNNKSTGKPDSAILTADFLVNKQNNKTFRDDFKAVTFGVVYGAGAKTIAKTLNITVEEAKIIINVIKSSIPSTIKMVEQASDFALKNAYVIHNSRTNSRKHFMACHKKFISEEEKVAISSEARNCRIQGTQADLLKEAMVNISRYYAINNIPNCPLLQIHDELVWKVKGKENCKHIARIMGETATLYLEGFTEMKAEAEVLHYWTK